MSEANIDAVQAGYPAPGNNPNTVISGVDFYPIVFDVRNKNGLCL
jgi:hypothetical protein